MPDNKMLDGIKKINGQDLEKARDIVLKSIGENKKHSHNPNNKQKPHVKAGEFNFEKDKKYNISKAKKVDGIFFGKISNAEKYVHHNEADKKIKQEEENRILAQQEKLRLAEEKEKAVYEKNKQEEKKQAMLNARAKAEKLKNTKTRKRENTPPSLKLRTRHGKTEKHENRKTKVLNKISGKKIADFFSVKAFLKFFAYALLVLAIALILFYILFFIALAIFNYDSSASRKLSEYLPVPVLITKIGAVEYYNYKDAKENFYYYNKNISEEKIKQELIKGIAVNDFAERYGIQVSDKEAEQKLSGIISGKSEIEIKEIMGAYYDLDRQRYLERIIKPGLMREAANQAILHDQEINHLALLKISKIEQAVKEGRDFYTVAEEVGDGFGFGKYYAYDEAILMFGDSAKNIGAGQTSDIVIISDRYYVIHCFAIRENSIGLRHVFVNAKSLDDYALEMVSGLKVWSFVN